METTTVGKEKSKPSWWRNSVILLALVGAMFGAFMSIMDTFVISKPFLGVDTLPAGYVFSVADLRTNVFAYLILGSWVGVLANLVFNRTFGKILNPGFKRERFISLKIQLPVMAAGFLAAIFTFTQIYVATGGDPSYLIALSNFAIVILVLIEGFRTRTLPKRKLFLAMLALIGSVLVSLESVSQGLVFKWDTLFLMIVVVGGTVAVCRVIERKATDSAGGVVNFNFWRFLWLAVSSSIFVPIFTIATGTFSQFVNVFASKALLALPYVVLTMFFAYGTNLLRIAAQRLCDDCNISRVSIILASTAAFALPLTLLAKSVYPEIYSIPSDPIVWVLRGFGTLLIVYGVIRLERLQKLES